VWIENRFVPYPFQNNIRYLDRDTKWKCLQGLVDVYKNPRPGKPAHFGEWIQATFGAGMGDVFMVPYNLKVWAFPLEVMDYNWIGERVAVTDLERVLYNVLHDRDDLSWGPNNTFQFPERGGSGAVWESVADMIGRERIVLGAEATAIDVRGKSLQLADGARAEYDVLISTIPIDRLVRLARLDDLEESAAALRHSSSHIVGIGLSGQPPKDIGTKCWMYFPEDNCPFYRVTVFSNYSPNNVPDISRHWSLMAEISESPHKHVDGQRVVADTIEGLMATRLMEGRQQVISTWHHRAAYGYPTPTLGRDACLDRIHGRLQAHDVYSRGRFGGWKYEVSNQDHSVMQGVELVDKLVLGVPEVTYWFPGTANNLAYAKSR
jgi:protoporphyrinogen oxidase